MIYIHYSSYVDSVKSDYVFNDAFKFDFLSTFNDYESIAIRKINFYHFYNPIHYTFHTYTPCIVLFLQKNIFNYYCQSRPIYWLYIDELF